jgi:hypothetical protein
VVALQNRQSQNASRFMLVDTLSYVRRWMGNQDNRRAQQLETWTSWVLRSTHSKL